MEGKVENGPFLFGKDDLPGLPHRAFSAVAPSTGEAARYEGVALAALFSDAMEVGADADTAVVHGEKGYAAPIPLAALRLLKPVLAPEAGTPVGQALLLAWPNLDHPGLDTDPRVRWWWVRGVRRIELQSWLATYGKALRVPQGAGDDARKGADAIASSCLACHQVRGVGGSRGPPLDGKAVTRSAPLLARPARHLDAVAPTARRADLAPSAGAQIAAFLSAIAVAGPELEEVPPEPEPPPARPPPALSPFGPVH